MDKLIYFIIFMAIGFAASYIFQDSMWLLYAFFGFLGFFSLEKKKRERDKAEGYV